MRPRLPVTVRPLSIQLTAWLALALFAFSQLSFALHLTLVAHRVCAEHGELVEVAPRSPTAVGEEQRAARSRVEIRGEIRTAPPPDAQGHQHQHCLLSPLRQPRGLQNAVALAAAITASQSARAPGCVAADCSPPIALLLLAPKSSPPA